MDSVQESCEEATRFHDERYAVNHEYQMAEQGDLHTSYQVDKTPFYERPPHQKESPLEWTPFEDAN